jgi:hypothetical protein
LRASRGQNETGSKWFNRAKTLCNGWLDPQSILTTLAIFQNNPLISDM